MKLVILDGYTINPGDVSWDKLEKMGDLDIYDRTPADKVIERIGNADALFTSKVKITGEIMDACPNMKFIGVLATGYDNIDIAAAKKRGIAVANVAGYSTDTVAQHTFALILEITNGVGLYTEASKAREWSNCPDFCLYKNSITQLTGKSLGIIGYGNIGKRVGAIAEAFGMKVNVYSKDKESTIKSDIITLHCPLSAENKGFINKDFISQMKDGAILINTARGGLINEVDLAAALTTGKLAAAAVDVLDGEPPRHDNPLLDAPNTFISCHVAWSSTQARKTICDTSADNLASFLEGGNLNRIV